MTAPNYCTLAIVIGAGVAAIAFDLYLVFAIPVAILILMQLSSMRLKYALILVTPGGKSFSIESCDRSFLLSLKAEIEEAVRDNVAILDVERRKRSVWKAARCRGQS